MLPISPSAATAMEAADAAELVANTALTGAGAHISLLDSAAARAGLRLEVLHTALRAYRNASDDGSATRSILTVIDYSLPSDEKRLWVLDVLKGHVLAHEFVAHGSGTGMGTATRFSNRPGSHQTSLGTFVTGNTYQGQHGLALRLHGLDAGLNDKALDRAIVVHGAWYVSEDIIRQQGRLGRSQGCPALSREAAPRVIELIKDGSVLFAYYPSSDLERALEQQ